MKRAQTEIIGLLVIVILFIFAGLIYLMFMSSPEESLTKDVTQSSKAQNMLDAFMQVTPCYELTPFEQTDKIIKDCYNTGENTCGKNCKELITDTLEHLMESYNPKQEYEFKITEIQGTEFISIGACSQEAQETRVATERITAGTQVLTLKLIYCVE